jgi:hypothetical protein
MSNDMSLLTPTQGSEGRFTLSEDGGDSSIRRLVSQLVHDLSPDGRTATVVAGIVLVMGSLFTVLWESNKSREEKNAVEKQ